MTDDLGKDLEALFERLRNGQAVLAEIVNRHALPWYEGNAGETDCDRLMNFMASAEKLAMDIHRLRGQELIDSWIEGICDIEEGYDPKKPAFIDRIDFEDVVRHYLNGGSAWGIGKNIKNQIDDLVETDRLVLLRTARQRFDSSDA